jgi:molecular chaperone DnaJ
MIFSVILILMKIPSTQKIQIENSVVARRDYYVILGVTRGSTQEEIRKAYRALARRFHPDRNNDNADAVDRFREITEAYDTLGEPERRKQYDRLGPLYHPKGKTPTPEELGAFISSTISSIFTKRGPNSQGENIEYSLQITLEDVLGTNKNISVRREIECSNCQGNGADGEKGKDTCQECAGSGKKSGKLFRNKCSRCDGKGFIVIKRCSTCGGLGRIDKIEELQIPVPKGVQAGQKLRIKGKGHFSYGTGDPGDLFIVITVSDHPLFERQGRDLYCEVPLLWTEAIFGTELKVPTLTDNTLIRIPVGTVSHKIFRLTGRGLPDAKGKGMGDMLVRVIIELPQALSTIQRRDFEVLSNTIASTHYPLRQQFLKELAKRGSS